MLTMQAKFSKDTVFSQNLTDLRIRGRWSKCCKLRTCQRLNEQKKVDSRSYSKQPQKRKCAINRIRLAPFVENLGSLCMSKTGNEVEEMNDRFLKRRVWWITLGKSISESTLGLLLILGFCMHIIRHLDKCCPKSHIPEFAPWWNT